MRSILANTTCFVYGFVEQKMKWRLHHTRKFEKKNQIDSIDVILLTSKRAQIREFCIPLFALPFFTLNWLGFYMYISVEFSHAKDEGCRKNCQPNPHNFCIPKHCLITPKLTSIPRGRCIFIQNDYSIFRKTETPEIIHKNHCENAQRTGKKMGKRKTTNYYLVLLVVHFFSNFCGFVDASIV